LRRLEDWLAGELEAELDRSKVARDSATLTALYGVIGQAVNDALPPPWLVP
jgi:hypothetical protein